MIPVIIRRHSLQDLTLGQSTLLTVPSCEERQIRRAMGAVNAERSDGLRRDGWTIEDWRQRTGRY
ncbi:MAG: hypothetical protein ACK6EB_46180, partial [Planctomyces sp.]